MNQTATNPLQTLVEAAFEQRAQITPRSVSRELRVALDECLDLLDSGKARVAEKVDGQWRVNEWLKKAVLLYFRTHDNQLIDAGYTRFFDKVPLKYADKDEATIRASGTRVVPDAVVRKGSYVGPDVVLMPSFVNIGAYVDAGTMVDTWATVGSAARRSAGTCTSPAASASAACSSRCRPRRRSSRTTASSAPAPRSSRA
jgi:2,3,4,5-tetrahydropyridine-2,6-dicarboxylate N-succinyltransferase